MRRSDREIKDFQDIVQVMEKCDVCRVAMHDNEYPYIVPLNFGFQVSDENDVSLYFHGAMAGKKYELIQKNNKVSFEMDCEHRLITREEACSCTMGYESVIGHGIIEILSDNEKYDALCLLMKHYHKGVFQFNQAAISHTAVFKLSVIELTGKRRMIN